jgi:hypothetical protein
MEWQAILMRFPVGNAIDIPNDWQPPVIGTVQEVKSLVQTAFPDAKHVDGLSIVEGGGFRVEFDYDAGEESDEAVRAVSVRSNGSLDAVPILKLASEILGCRLFDSQTGKFADFGVETEASINDFLQLCRRIKNERRWVFGVTVAFVTTLHVLQDSGLVPAKEAISKPAVASFGIVGLILLNLVVFLTSIIIAMRQVQQLAAEDESAEEKDEAAETILVPAFQGRGQPPMLVARYLHIPIAALFGMIAGSILAWGISVVFF